MNGLLCVVIDILVFVATSGIIKSTISARCPKKRNRAAHSYMNIEKNKAFRTTNDICNQIMHATCCSYPFVASN